MPRRFQMRAKRLGPRATHEVRRRVLPRVGVGHRRRRTLGEDEQQQEDGIFALDAAIVVDITSILAET